MSVIEITPIAGPLGAVVAGVDLRQPVDAESFEAIRDALADRLLVVFPEQYLDLDQEQRFAAAFGPLWHHPAARGRAAGAGAASAVLDSRRDPGGGRGAGAWHADATFTAEPPAYTMLSAQVVPEHGGATSFANQQHAYGLLDDAWRERLEGMRAVHVPPPRQVQRAPGLREHTHPAVRVDERTGRRSLFVNPGFTRRFEHMTVEASRPFLRQLFRAVLDPGGRHDHQWAAGDLVVWDNRALAHRANHDHGEDARVLSRVTVAA